MAKSHHLLSAYRQLWLQSNDIVLATILETSGSTYQKAGARMLITTQGELIGLLGGGCFEADLIEHAQSVFSSGVAKTVFYDMRSPDDSLWGLGLGCNGAVKIFLQLLSADTHYSPLNILNEACETQQAGLLVTICESLHPDFPVGHSLFLPASGFATVQAAPFAGRVSALPALGQQRARVESLTVGEHLIKAFYDPIQPPTHLLIIGAGVDSVPVLDCAKALGWRVTVVDHRAGHLQKQRFPQADRLLHLQAEELSQHLDLNQFNAAVLMTHNMGADQRFLAALAESALGFIGLLGPHHRRARLLQSLGDAAETIDHRLYGPIGLDIGAETPEEIALSIVAGIQAVLTGRSGEQLSRKALTQRIQQS